MAGSRRRPPPADRRPGRMQPAKRQARPRWKNKGRYLLLALALSGGAALYGRGSPQGQSPLTQLSRAQLSRAQSLLTPLPSLGGDPACQPNRRVHPAPAAPARLSGRLGLYVAVIDPRTLRPLREVGTRQNEVFPLASAYKQAVLWALLRRVDAGELSLNQTFTVTRASQSLGAYPFDGSSVTVLAQRMIANSDNTATDLLHRWTGLAAVQGLADDLRLCQTRLILPTKDWWVALSGLGGSFPGPAAFGRSRGEVRLRLAATLDAQAQAYRADYLQRKLDRYFEAGPPLESDLGTVNVSTPAEFGDLIAHEFLASGLSAQSSALQRQLMALGPGRSRLQAPIQTFGGKGGNGWRTLIFSGYLQTRGGEHVVYSFMQHGADQTYTLTHAQVTAAFDWINAAMKTVLVEGDGGRLAVGSRE